MSAPLVQEWVDKAEADYQGAHALQRQRKHPLPDLVCFHCQQSAEKYLLPYITQALSGPFWRCMLEKQPR
jgi:HEPN domain-containing protein